MAKIVRKIAKIFAGSPGLNQVAEFGSLAAGTPTFSTDPAVIQSLSQWINGWFSAVIGANSPAIEDMNAFCFVMAYQIAYMMQEGVPEWEVGTIYFKGSLAQDGNGVVYVSLTDNNTGNALSSSANWSPPGGTVSTQTANYTVLSTDGLIKADATAGAFNLTLPAASANLGKAVLIKKIDSSAHAVTLLPTGGDLIDGEVSQLLQGPMAAITLKCDGISNWYVF